MIMLERIPSGVEGLDELIEGGLPKRRTFLVSGATGAGKTIFSMQFLYNGAIKYGEPGIYVTLDERPELVREDMARFGWDIKQLEEERKLVILDATVSRIGIPSDEEYSLESINFDYKNLLRSIIRIAKEIGAKRVVIDSIATMGMYFKNAEEVRAIVLEMVYVLSKLGVTSFLVSELEPSTNQLSKYGVEEFVADGVFILKYLDTNIQNVNRTLLIRKMRATKHSSYIHPVEITPMGMAIKKIEDYIS